MARRKADRSPCQWINERDAFRAFATHGSKTQSARHIKPLHWYIACRLVIEGGFDPDDITPRPPFSVKKAGSKSRPRHMLHYDPALGGTGEQTILGGLKTKNVDVVVNRPSIGPVIAVSCKGTTKAFRNLSNRMEETIGECTNLHITYPAMVVGYFAVLRANRTVQDVLDAPDIDSEDTATDLSDDEDDALEVDEVEPLPQPEKLKANDIALLEGNAVAEGIVRFHAALCEMTSRRGIRDEISRYESMAVSLVEPRGDVAGTVYPGFPPPESPLHLHRFFQTLYQCYEERFVYGAPLLAERGLTTRLEWDPESPALTSGGPSLNFTPRTSSR